MWSMARLTREITLRSEGHEIRKEERKLEIAWMVVSAIGAMIFCCFIVICSIVR